MLVAFGLASTKVSKRFAEKRLFGVKHIIHIDNMKSLLCEISYGLL